VELRKDGLDAKLKKVMVPHWVPGIETGEIVEFPGMAAGTTQKIVLAALGGSIATASEGMTAEIVVVKSFEELTALGRDKIAGKIVLFNNKFDTEMQASGFGGAAYGQAVAFRFGGAMAAARLGAIGVLVRSAGGSQNRLAHTGSMGYDPAVTKIPGAAVSFEDAETLAYLTAMGKVRVHFTLTPQTLPDAVSYNVVGELKGSEKPDEIVVVGGHLDSWDPGTGALNDAAGFCVSVQSCYHIKPLKLKPKRTIRVVAFMNEENGGAGGRGYFEENKNDVGKHFAAIESDLGASHPLGFYFSGKAEALTFFAPISNILLAQGANQVQLQPGGVGADIGPLTQGGVPSFAPWFNQQTYFNYPHTAADTFDKNKPKERGELGPLNEIQA